jgi:hypothetical protein
MALARNQWLKILWNVLTYGVTDSSVNRRGATDHVSMAKFSENLAMLT